MMTIGHEHSAVTTGQERFVIAQLLRPADHPLIPSPLNANGMGRTACDPSVVALRQAEIKIGELPLDVGGPGAIFGFVNGPG